MLERQNCDSVCFPSKIWSASFNQISRWINAYFEILNIIQTPKQSLSFWLMCSGTLTAHIHQFTCTLAQCNIFLLLQIRPSIHMYWTSHGAQNTCQLGSQMHADVKWRHKYLICCLAQWVSIYNCPEKRWTNCTQYVLNICKDRRNCWM